MQGATEEKSRPLGPPVRPPAPPAAPPPAPRPTGNRHVWINEDGKWETRDYPRDPPPRGPRPPGGQRGARMVAMPDA